MLQIRFFFKKLRAFLRGRAIAWIVFAFLLSGCFLLLMQNLHIVTIIDGGEKRDYFTFIDDPCEILEREADIFVIGGLDSLDITETGINATTINLHRAFDVTILVDGSRREYTVTGGTLQELFERANVELNTADIVSLPLESKLADGMEVTVDRMEIRVWQEEEVIPYETDYRRTPLLRNGRTRTLSAGSDGLRIYEYEQLYKNGEPVGDPDVVEWVEKEPVTATALMGAEVPISHLMPSVPFELDENGEPTSYVKVFRNMVGTAYSASPTAKGAGGYPAREGYVAVRNSQFPYGTKLYIKCCDGSGIVYGYCIAGDTGTGLMDHIIDVDVCFDTYLESVLWGYHKVDIFVLEWGTGEYYRGR